MELRPQIRALAAQVWRARWRVERESGLRFARMAERLARVGAPAELVERARAASQDEARHTVLCAELATELGARVDPAEPVPFPNVWPADLDDAAKTTYEVVAACCITETESVGVLTTLLHAEQEPQVRAALHAIATDEVQHARLGWAYLTWLRERGPLAWLAPHVPHMLTGSVSAQIFSPPSDPAEDDPELLRLGLLRASQKAPVMAGVVREVIAPGLEELGIDAALTRVWIDARWPAHPSR